MADNTVLNPGTGGDTIRDIDRGGGLKTQVVQLDAGGESNESLVDQFNPLPTADQAVTSAQSPDSPIFTAVTGDPSGDFAGEDFFSHLFDDAKGNSVRTKIVNLKQDSSGALVTSDAPDPIFGVGSQLGDILFTVDTTGYQSLSVQLQGVWSATVSFVCSNDGATWYTCAGWSVGGNPTMTLNATSNAIYGFPCVARYFQTYISAYTSGQALATLYMRATDMPQISSSPSMNLSTVGNTSVVTAGLAGVQAVGGNVAIGVAPTTNPLNVGGADQNGATRRFLTDTVGSQCVVGPSLAADPYQSPVQTSEQQIGFVGSDGLIDALNRIARELRLLNVKMTDLPGMLSRGFVNTDSDDAFLTDPSNFMN